MTYLDGAESDDFDVFGLADYICERVSIGSVVASPLEVDLETLSELDGLDDE